MSVRRALKFDEKRSFGIYYSLCNAVKGDILKQIFLQKDFLSVKVNFSIKCLLNALKLITAVCSDID